MTAGVPVSGSVGYPELVCSVTVVDVLVICGHHLPFLISAAKKRLVLLLLFFMCRNDDLVDIMRQTRPM